jgi:dTDP-4-dehydrorhamnose reductase
VSASRAGGAPSRGARWLCFGAGGQLGRSFAAVAAARGVEAHALARADVDIADATSVARALDRVRPEVVLNCAAMTKVDLCESEAAEAERANALAPALLARACRGRALLVHLSTEYVFSGEACRPIPEDAPTEPLSVYGRTKLAGETAVREAGGEHLLVRTQWVFGPGPNFVRTILAAAARGQALTVVEDQLGRPTWSAALARAILGAVEAGARGTLHLACEGIASWCDFARAIVAEGARRGLAPEVPVRPIATRELARPAARPAYGVLSLERARKLGLELPHWQEALAAYLDCEREKRDA